MTTLTIQRHRWLRGQGKDSALQHAETGKRCCLGFLALACGFSEEQITGIQTPSGVVLARDGLIELWPEGMFKVHPPESRYPQHSENTSKAMLINDEPLMTDSEREAQLIELFKTAWGITLTFTD